jgi:DNA-binding CsgD family transcriptional regulator
MGSAEHAYQPPHGDRAAQGGYGEPSLAADDLEGALMRARGLLDVALRESRERQSAARGVVEYYPNVDALRAEVQRLLPTVRRELLTAAPHAEWYAKSKDRLGQLRQILTGMVNRGVMIRKLYTVDAMATLLSLPGYRDGFGRVGPQIRVSETPLSEVVILDGHTAFLRVQAHDHEQCLGLRVPAILQGLRTLYSAAWDAASDLDLYLRRQEGDLDETAAWIMRMLSEGYKDDVAARELGVSVRTYRRHVAEIMRNLNASSRFQAGVRAAELGLTANGA